MKLIQIHHIAIIASDYQKSKEFYVEKLGFEVVKETYRPENPDYRLDLKGDNCDIELFGIEHAPERLNYPEACGLRHLAFRVECIESVVEELNAMGIETEPIRMDKITNKKMTFFKDPDGLPLELHE